MVPPAGIIITVSVLLAAGIAAYENPQVRQWIDQSRQKLAMALHALGDDVYPRSRSPRQDDPSMREDASELAEARRRQARAEILERGRIMEERRRRKKTADGDSTPSRSFDALVDKDGMLKTHDDDDEVLDLGVTSGAEAATVPEGLTNRHAEPPAKDLHESVDSPISLRQLSPRPTASEQEADPFASRYEQEMRSAWNLPFPRTGATASSNHASESLIDLTPTSESPPDPDVSIPGVGQSQQTYDGSQYFSATASRSSHTLSNEEGGFYYAHPSNPWEPIQPVASRASRSEGPFSVSSAPSIAGSIDHVHASEAEDSEDGILSEFGDGIRTPASGWTEVGSIMSSDAGN